MRSSPEISALTAGISFSAAMQAFTKNDMKPSFTPCFFSKPSLYWSRSAITALMSTSLKVVSMAAVFCASLRRSAIRLRRRVMRTRSSRGPDSRAIAGAEGVGCTAGAEVPWAMAVSTSPLVSLPSLPVAAIVAGSSLFSATSLRAAGPDRSMLDAAAAAVGAGVGGAGVGGTGAVGAATAAPLLGLVAWAGLAADLAPASPIRPSRPPTTTLAPSSAAISAIVPAAGEGTSRVTLSVSSSTSASSTATVSPIFFSHRATVASVIDSPRVGTLISVAMIGSCSALSRVSSVDRQSTIDDLGLLGDVPLHAAGRGPCRLGTADIARPLGGTVELAQQRLDPMIDEGPGTHILGLFLAPDDLGLAVALQFLGQG